MNTTLNKIRAYKPCKDGWEKLLKHLGKTEADDEALSMATILESNGIDDAIWALRSLEDCDREIRHFACDCAEHVLPVFEADYPDDSRPRDCITVARRYADGQASSDELAAAYAAAAYTATIAAAAAAAVAAAAAAYAADAAAYAAAYAADAAAYAAADAYAYAAAADAYAAVEVGAERAYREERFKFWFCS